uniref:Uncharacterized protein n=1 Tax=Arundo donax TaxID=35708 RepID=A0A0A9I3H3_ARUDO
MSISITGQSLNYMHPPVTTYKHIYEPPTHMLQHTEKSH